MESSVYVVWGPFAATEASYKASRSHRSGTRALPVESKNTKTPVAADSGYIVLEQLRGRVSGLSNTFLREREDFLNI